MHTCLQDGTGGYRVIAPIPLEEPLLELHVEPGHPRIDQLASVKNGRRIPKRHSLIERLATVSRNSCQPNANSETPAELTPSIGSISLPL
jgi:hypothetical protein